MTAIYHATEVILRSYPRQPVILDGRTFSQPGQWEPVQKLVNSLNVSPVVIECVCSDDVARQRIARDYARGHHLAKNRTPELYDRVRAAAVSLTVPRLTLDTGELPTEECVRQALQYILSRC